LHEYLGGKSATNTMYVPSGLVFRDWRDSPGEGVRMEHRNLKVLLHYWENIDPKFGARWAFFNDLVFRFTLAHEAVEVFPAWSRELLANVMERLEPADVGMRSDCHYHKARSLEAEGRFDDAILAYQEADKTSPHTQALLRAWKRTSQSLGELHEMVSYLGNLILARVGHEAGDATPYNCDLKLLDELRVVTKRVKL
jgi:tetratricopeptide (TPR) repeat protein